MVSKHVLAIAVLAFTASAALGACGDTPPPGMPAPNGPGPVGGPDAGAMSAPPGPAPGPALVARPGGGW